MTLVAVVLPLAVALGRLRGGRLSRLGAQQLAQPSLVAVAVAAQIAAAVNSSPLLPLLIGYGAMATFLWRNRRLPGMTLITSGWVLNAAVVLVNGGMPVSRTALAAAGGATPPAGWHLPLVHTHRLRPLADVIALPGVGVVVSVGDLLLAAGVGVLVVRLMGTGTDRVRR